MGTEVLRPQTILIRPPQPSFNHPRRKNNLSGNRNRKKRPDPPPPSSRRSLSLDGEEPRRHVTILRRGQSIGDLNNASSRADVYAGSAVATSPSPRALPLPSFFSRKVVVSLSPSRSDVSDDDSATREIRRLLRLEF